MELPSWAFGSGTRFKLFAQPGGQRDPCEKPPTPPRCTGHSGVAPSVALHLQPAAEG